MLLAKIAGALKALPTRAAGLFQAPLSQVARLAEALEDKTPAEAARVQHPTPQPTAADAAEAADATDDSRHRAPPRLRPTATDTPAEPAE